MSYNLRVVYDERDNLEAWIPEFDAEDRYDTEPGPYEMFSNARLKGIPPALDWLIVDGFSRAFSRVIAEVKSKEASIPDRYDVPEFGLYDVTLSRVLEHVYHTLVPKKAEVATVVVTRQAIPLPRQIMRQTNIRDNTRLAVRVIDADTLQFTRLDGTQPTKQTTNGKQPEPMA